MFSIHPAFIWNFKTGDNIVYNLSILAALYEQYESLSADPLKQHLLIKPIVIINVSITEALLHDFLHRVKGSIREGVANLSREVISAIRGKQFDQFEHYIAQARKHDLFDSKSKNLYETMDSLRKKRNRIHIQNTLRYDPIYECNAFAEKDKIGSEKVLEKLLYILSEKYPRGMCSVEEFHLPWERHFT
jgi:hypothetical protein